MVLRKSVLEKRVGAIFVAVALVFASAPTWAQTDSENDGKKNNERELAEEPFFTTRSFAETEIEFEIDYENFAAKEEIGFALGGSWAFGALGSDEMQIGAEVPIGIRIPDNEATASDLGDVEFSVLYQFNDMEKNENFPINLAIVGEVAAPTGNQDKDIGGKGSWAIFGTAGYLIPLASEVGLQLQVGYEQQIDLTDAQEREAEELGVAAVREKELIWGGALNTKIKAGAGSIIPTFEVVGRTILEAIEEVEEGTIVELGGGIWWKSEDDLAIGVAGKAPVTDMKESNYSVVFAIKKGF